jgi:hypothetical protein
MTRKEETVELIDKEESYAIIGASFELYKNRGCGSTNRSTTNAWRSSLNSREFRSYQNHRKVCSIAVARWFATGCKLGLLLNFCHYQDWNTTASCAEAMNPPISTSEKFRVFSRV